MHDNDISFSKPVKLESDERWYDNTVASLGNNNEAQTTNRNTAINKSSIGSTDKKKTLTLGYA